MNIPRKLRSTVGNVLPEQFERVGRWGYRRWQQFQADLAFRRRELSDVAVESKDDTHVVVAVVDALRADAIASDVTPLLAGLDGTSTVAPAPWTYPSVASLMTGRYPHEHGAIRRNDDPDRGGDDFVLPPALPPDEVTLPEYLAAAGFETLGSFGFTMPFLPLKGRFERHRLHHKAPAERVLSDYRQWRNGSSTGRTFAYLHLFDLHGPFDDTPPKRYWDDHDIDTEITGTESWRFTDEWEGPEVEQYIEHRKRLYRAALDYVDDQLAAFVETFSEDTAVVVTGDHGDAFWEKAAFDAARFRDPRPAYSVGHGGTPYEPIVRVPLLGDSIHFADCPTSLVDIAPTVLDHCGLAPADEMTGIAHQTDIPEDRILLTEAARFGHEKKAVTADGWKLLVSRGDDQRIGFALPEETVCELPDAVEDRLHDALPSWPSDDADREVGDHLQERLEDLGYA